MSLSKEETIAVIAGSIAGFIVLLSVLAAIIYCCVKRRKREHRASTQKPFRHYHLTPDTSLSKNSGPHAKHAGEQRHYPDTRLDPRLDPRADPRLPKVGSNSLWFGTPSMYSASPSQVYQDMKRKGSDRPVQEHPGLQGPPGHMVYRGPNVGSRIYHSQQVVPGMYESDYRLPRSGSYMDLYSYPYGYDPYRDINNSQAMLMNHPDAEEYYLDRYREREVRRTGKKVRRSQSDVTLHSTRRAKNRKQRKETPFDKEQSTRSRDSEDRSSNERYEHRPRRSQSNERELVDERTVVADVHRQKKPAPAPPKPKPKRDEIQSKSMEFSDPEISESATDSAKLRALERERERNREAERAERKKKEDYIKNENYSVYNRGFVDDNGTSDLNVRPYNYEGKPSIYESSIVAKMAALTDTPKATYIHKQSNVENKTKSNEQPPSTEAFHAQVAKKLEKLQDRTVPPLDLTEGPVATSTGNHSRASRPTSGKRRSRRGSNLTDQDGNVITEQAFQFLEGYSDGEGTDYIDSGSITPTIVKDYDINL